MFGIYDFFICSFLAKTFIDNRYSDLWYSQIGENVDYSKLPLSVSRFDPAVRGRMFGRKGF